MVVRRGHAILTPQTSELLALSRLGLPRFGGHS
jgi:hypothetical protein